MGLIGNIYDNHKCIANMENKLIRGNPRKFVT